jgi:hypothetical protein
VIGFILSALPAPARFALAGLCALALAFVAGLHTGTTRAEAAATAQQATAAAHARKTYDASLAAAYKQATQAQAEARAARDFATQLEQEKSHVRVPLVSARACPGPARAAVGRVAAAPMGEAPTAEPAGVDGLTFHAVRLWNSALAGKHLPAGACGADDPESPACAAGAGITVDAAWSNHTENAARCAEDRARYDRLTDYLRSRP